MLLFAKARLPWKQRASLHQSRGSAQYFTDSPATSFCDYNTLGEKRSCPVLERELDIFIYYLLLIYLSVCL